MNWDGDAYEARFTELAAAGQDVHGEADFVAGLASRVGFAGPASLPVSILDAGCGTGRVARELARRGFEVVGVDADSSMIATARRLAPELTWVEGDLCDFALGRTFSIVVLAGNVPLFTPPGTEPRLVAGCARHVAPGGYLVAGFQLGKGYALSDHDAYCGEAGLLLAERWSTWEMGDFPGAGDYAVSVHHHPA